MNVDVALPPPAPALTGYQAVWNSGSYAVLGRRAQRRNGIHRRDAVVLLSDASGMSLPG